MLTKKQKLVLDKIREFRRRNGPFPDHARDCRRRRPLLAGDRPGLSRAHARARGAGQKGPGLGSFRMQDPRPLGDWPCRWWAWFRPAVLEMFAELGDEVVLPEWLAEKGGDIVAFRVQGQSMKDAYIQDGDLVLIQRTEKADPGQMVVARLADGSITLKRLKRVRDAYVFLVRKTPIRRHHRPLPAGGPGGGSDAQVPVKTPSVLHLDIDAFFAAVEEAGPIAGKPLIVGGLAHERGVVCTASYAARGFGVHSGYRPAHRGQEVPAGRFSPRPFSSLQPDLRAVFACLRRFSPRVEEVSVDEAYVDVGGSRIRAPRSTTWPPRSRPRPNARPD